MVWLGGLIYVAAYIHKRNIRNAANKVWEKIIELRNAIMNDGDLHYDNKLLCFSKSSIEMNKIFSWLWYYEN